MTIVGTTQLPPGGDQGYIHWSSLIYKRKDTQSTDNVFRSLSGWDAFQCPSIDKGRVHLPPTNTYSANSDGLPNDAGANVVDMQAPRCAFTVNEAICPRNKFCIGFQGAVRTYAFVHGGKIKNSGATILATELPRDERIMVAPGEVSGSDVCKSHRPIPAQVCIAGRERATGFEPGE